MNLTRFLSAAAAITWLIADELAERNCAKAEREAEKASVLQADIPVSIDHNLIPADMHARIVRPIAEPEFEPGTVLGKISQPSSEPDFMLKSGNQTNDLLNSLSLLCQDLTDLCLTLRKLTDACVMRIDQCECPRR
ncbi:hypothetical protein INS90_09800 [Trueperella pecoris]|uniref:Uncharacterized protein n=1 Tax=Trueperella pecoris TaxID=2733571 RepID=A0A7M1R231_9ACTO|nr:hypothetical protein [Trueperella pecoris]QOR47525.1 hypothetical protein INS90_09800 [Trueperella pecoris]